MSGSDRQRRDVVEMLVINVDTVDRQYLERWADDLGIGNALAELWGEARQELDGR